VYRAAAQGYAFLLLRAGASLAGLGYLALLIAAFVNPPLRGAYEEHDEMGRAIEGPASAPAQVYSGAVTSLGTCHARDHTPCLSPKLPFYSHAMMHGQDACMHAWHDLLPAPCWLCSQQRLSRVLTY
jgi:hypothetical protein